MGLPLACVVSTAPAPPWRFLPTDNTVRRFLMALDLVAWVVVRLFFDIAARLGRHSFEGGGAAKRGNPEGAPAVRPRALARAFFLYFDS